MVRMRMGMRMARVNVWHPDNLQCRQQMAEKPDYGVDAPGVIRNLLLSGGALLVASIFVDTVHIGNVKLALRRMMLFWGAILVLEGFAMLLYSKVGKFAH